MQLTKEQIQDVRAFLDAKHFNYIDLKVEILDHMISDIEQFMQHGHTFESAFAKTRIRWNKHFKTTSSFMFGRYHTNFKLVVKKAITAFKPFYKLYFIAFGVPYIVFKIWPITVSTGIAATINGFVAGTAIMFVLYMLYVWFSVFRLKEKTTYSFILNTKYSGILLLIIGAVVGVFNSDNTLNPAFTSFVCAGYATTYTFMCFFKKHKAVLLNYKQV